MDSPNPTPQRQRVRIYPTPNVTDVLFYETVSLDRGAHPEYGSKHPTPLQWPDHKLVFITPVEDAARTNLFRYYYVADRLKQDLYNWSFTDADIGGTKFKAVERVYIIPRKDFVATSPAMGAAMPDSPASLFATGYVLAERKQGKVEEKELNSIYVFEVRTYVTKVPISEIIKERTMGVGLKRTTTLYYRGETLTASTPIETVAANPAHAYWGTQADGVSRECQQLTDNWWAVTETGSLDAALAADFQILPGTTDLKLPDVLRGVAVTWNKDSKSGSFASNWVGVSAWVGEVDASLSASESASADGSASIQPTIVPDIVENPGTDIPCKDVFFNLKLASGVITEDALIAKLNTLLGLSSPDTVIRWPKFHPEAHTFISKGQRVSVSAQVSASAAIRARIAGADENNNKEKTVGVGEGFDFSTMSGTDHIRPTIHGIISAVAGNFTGTLSDSAPVTATCSVGWDANSVSDVDTVAGLDILIPTVDGTSSGDGYKSSSAAAAGSVFPTELAATSPAAIPSSGIYITKSTLSPFPGDTNWYNCYAEIVDASQIQ